MGIKQFGHLGVYVWDMPKMISFYTDVMGLQITDRDEEEHAVFFSSRPDEIHHEFVLLEGRAEGADGQINQISWELESLQDLLDFHARLRDSGVVIDISCTHGIAYGIYFFDPEGNRSEVWWDTDRTDIPQPYRRPLNLDQSADEVLAEAARIHAADGF